MTIEVQVPAVLEKLNQQRLNDHIAMEDWERRLLPLFLFKGTKPYRIRALWNIAYGMFLTECESMSLGAHSIGAGDTGHLCGAHRVPQNMRSIFDRLRLSRQVTDSVSKAFTEYVEWIHPRPFHLERVPYQDKRFREGVTAWWRVPGPKKVRVWKQPEAKTGDGVYPFVQNAYTKEHQLLFDVHQMLPKGLPHEIRGDLCQDLIVAVLSGETSIGNIPDVVAKYARDAKKILPDRWKNVSIDDIVPGTDDFRLMDTLTADMVDDHICGAGCGHDVHDGDFTFLKALDR